MPDAILWIWDTQRWLYLGLLALCGLQLWFFWHAHHRLRFAPFNIERENLIAARSRALALLVLWITLIAAILLSNIFIAPNLTTLLDAPPTATPPTPVNTPGPTVTPEFVLPGLESPTPEVALGPTLTRTPVPPGGSGCMFPLATLTSPVPGQVLSGRIEVRGTANIENFAFYIVEVSSLGDNWLTVITSQRPTPEPSTTPDPNVPMQPVVDGVLGEWDTSLIDPGEYALRLTVYNSSGGHLTPCTIPITIQSPFAGATATP